MTTHPQNQRYGTEDQDHDNHNHGRTTDNATLRHGEPALHAISEIPAIRGFMTVSLNNPDLVDGFVDAIAQISHAILGFTSQFLYAPTKHHDRHHHQRNSGNHHQCQLEAGGEQHSQAAK